MRQRFGKRRGAVLATAIYYLSLLGLLVVGTLYAAHGANAGAEGVVGDATLTGAIDHSLATSVASWDAPVRSTQIVGSRAAIPFAPLRGITGATTVTRLGPSLYWIATNASSSDRSMARRSATLLVRALVARPIDAPIVSQGDVTIGANASVTVDSASSADCPASSRTALALAPDAALRVDGTRAEELAIERLDVVGTAAPFEQFGVESWSTLWAKADVRLRGGESIRPSALQHASCLTNRAGDDWGDRTAADGCVVAPPIITVAGDLTIEGGEGKGIVLIDGHLRITGAFAFTGVIIARGGVEITSDDVVITGRVLAARLTTPNSVTSGTSLIVLGRTQIHASTCAAYRVLASHAGIRSVHARAWLERF